MVEQRIVEYIANGVSQGYNAQQLREHLIKNGFPAQSVDAAMAEVNSTKGLPNIPKEPLKNTQKPTQKATMRKSLGSVTFKRRNPWVVLLLTIITLGIYGIYWFVATTMALSKATNKIKPWMIILLFIPLINFIVFWKHSKAVTEYSGKSNVLIFLLWIIFSPVAMVLSQVELNKRAV